MYLMYNKYEVLPIKYGVNTRTSIYVCTSIRGPVYPQESKFCWNGGDLEKRRRDLPIILLNTEYTAVRMWASRRKTRRLASGSMLLLWRRNVLFSVGYHVCVLFCT